MGRPWPQPGEPLFTDDDIEAVLEHIRYQKMLCPGCGMPRDETMHQDAWNEYEGHAVRCQACAARDRRAEFFMKDVSKGRADDAGMFFTVTPIEPD